MWLAYKIYSVTENENLFTIRNTVSEKLFILLKLGCLGNACQPQKLINILGSEPWLLIKTVAYKKFSVTSSRLLIGPSQNCNMFHLGKGTANVHGRVTEPVILSLDLD